MRRRSDTTFDQLSRPALRLAFCWFPYVLPLPYLWASPFTLLGLGLGLVGLCSGGKARVRDGAVEFYGGVKRSIDRLPGGQFVLGLTLGHVILGPTDAALDIARPDKLVHVRHFETWGP